MGAALFGSNVSDRLISLREELPISLYDFTRTMVLGLAHGNVGGVAQRMFSKSCFR